jgi:hypothetical protein
MWLSLYLFVGIIVSAAVAHRNETQSPIVDAVICGVFWPIAMAVRFFTK